MIPTTTNATAANEHQRCGSKPAQANGLGTCTNAHSPERAAQREDARFCPALSATVFKNKE